MTYATLGFAHRKENVSIDECKDGIHKKIVPLLKELCGPAFPLTYTTHWPALVKGEAGARFPTASKAMEGLSPIMLVGAASKIDWDFMVLSTFRDELHFQQFLAVLNSDEVAPKIRELEEAVTDGDKLTVLVLGEIHEASS